MSSHEVDPDVVRWGLHNLNVCCLAGGSSSQNITKYDKDWSSVGYLRENYRETEHTGEENDEAIAHARQDESSRITVSEPSGSSDNQLASAYSNDQLCPLNDSDIAGHQNWQDVGERGGVHSWYVCPKEVFFDGETVSCSPQIAHESTLDGKLGKRINHMVPVRHVPKINGEIPSIDEETSDHQRLMDRLWLYDLVELKVLGDGNCQFRSLSDQIYRTTEHHKFVREQIVDQQLKSNPELYQCYVPMPFYDYVKKMRKVGEWGDHVTLQAAADVVSLTSPSLLVLKIKYD
jgi:hypothetical protein